LTSATIDLRASGTGPASAALGTSADGFAQTSVVAITETPTTATLSVTGAVGTIELRLFGYGATGAMGTLRIEHALTLHGSVQ
jgi:hypothetical protein